MPIAAGKKLLDALPGKDRRLPLFLIGGPCVIEDEAHSLSLADRIRSVCEKLDIPFIFKASFDKANRSSLSSYRGPGLEKGLKILSRIRESTGVPVVSDVHETWQVGPAAEVLDMLQIPAFLCRQTDLLQAAGRTQKPVNLKKGQFLSPCEIKNAVQKITATGNQKIILTERGTLFGYQNLIVDMRAIPIMSGLGYPVVIDASHSVQKPGGEGTSSGGDANDIPLIARCGIAAGAAGVFCEIHDNPPTALSDRHNSLLLNDLEPFLRSLIRIRSALDADQ